MSAWVIYSHILPSFTPATSILWSSTSFLVGIPCCGSSDVLPTMSQTLLQLYIASAMSQLQGGCHGISCAAWSRASVPEWSCSCRRPARSSPTSLVIITSTACSTIPAHNRWSMHISIAPLELIAIWHPSSPSLPVFRQRLKTFLT